MKSVILIFFLINLGIYQNLSAQEISKEEQIEHLSSKSLSQKKSGLTLLAFGGVSAGVGYLLLTQSDLLSGEGAFGAALFLIGSTLTIVSIPILISSAVKSKKAANLKLDLQSFKSIQLLQKSNVHFPSVTFTMNF
ncbi:hypothetical protein [Algoriphagus hitonicola]|uniref:Uncharacterized protein n=1 Tax=Algoriphagus hitonicola TaxID=435880 RepID=A0A1I2R4W3_9BACT|nr:hypothetical protein [Algoriphagus hitonicola]SFG35528.1 hypothetical protein SAMN04487988_10371 [Algoriphagus hitonicola]